jgi:hypothetical protein
MSDGYCACYSQRVGNRQWLIDTKMGCGKRLCVDTIYDVVSFGEIAFIGIELVAQMLNLLDD